MNRRIIYTAVLAVTLALLPEKKANAQIIEAINQALIKVINAIDIKVQQIQNQTIQLQNAEKELENKMQLDKLNNISGWLNKEKKLYADYYQELQKVKQVIADYQVVKRIIQQQSQLVSEYRTAYNLFKQDDNFSADQLSSMGNVYNGILQESIRNLDEVMLAVNAFTTQMSDAERLQVIHKASGGMQKNLDDLRQFNNQNIQYSLQVAKEKNNMQHVRQLYGLTNK